MYDSQPGQRNPYCDLLPAGRSGNRIPVEGESFRTRPDRSGAHPASRTNSTGSSPGVKRPGRGDNHHPPHLAPKLKNE
jgi:hypothetical protein